MDQALSLLISQVASIVSGRHVVIVDGIIIDTGVTAQWVISNITHRSAAVNMCALFRKPSAPSDAKYIGFEMPDGMLVG